jgi:hypothetical protein
VNSDGGLTRRGFLLLAAACGVPLLAGRAAAGLWPNLQGWPSTPAERLAGLLRHTASARVIGSAYLRSAPSEARARSLVEAIAAGLDGGSAALRSADGELRGLLARRIARDFEEDATVCLNGWVVSRTEARLCALAALV